MATAPSAGRTLWVVAVLAAVGWGSVSDARTVQAVSLAPEQLRSVPAEGPRVTKLTCAAAPWATFGPAALRRAAGYERRGGPAARELRHVLRLLRVDGGLPQRRWYLLARDHSRLLFANGRGATLASLTLQRRRGRWSFSNSGGCEPRAVRAGLGAAHFHLATAPDGSDVLHLLIDDDACASGHDARGRVLPPRVWLSSASVTVTVYVRPPGGVQTCEGSPPTAVDVTLPEGLGDRDVLDGGAPVPVRVHA